MPFLVTKQTPRQFNMSLEDILNDVITEAQVYAMMRSPKTMTETRTIYTKNTDKLRKLMAQLGGIATLITKLENFYEKHKDLDRENMNELYYSFQIPKKSGKGFREINAPNAELKIALTELKLLIEDMMLGNTYHTAAFAYVRGRNTIQSVKRHQANASRWFLKEDCKNFFPSITPDCLYNMMSMIFPFSCIVEYSRGEQALKNALKFCFLNGGLPQGTPTSPLLTNIMMIPIDYEIFNACLKAGEVIEGVNFDGSRDVNHKLVYTRYADDILISCRYGFSYIAVENYITSVFEKYGVTFSLGLDKRRYGSNAGSNWNLGLMLNKNNDLTIGAKKKKQLKAALTYYANAKKNGESWDLYDVQVLHGQINAYKQVEKENIEYIIDEYSKKFQIDIMSSIKADLKVKVQPA